MAQQNKNRLFYSRPTNAKPETAQPSARALLLKSAFVYLNKPAVKR